MEHLPIHTYEDRVRFEDVDAAAIVYHPVYLTYLERARSQSLIEEGHSFKRLLDEGLGIVVASAEMKYVRPLFLDDRFVVATQINDYGKSVINVTQAIANHEADLSRGTLRHELRQIESLRFFAHLKLVVISRNTGRPTTIPPWLMKIFTDHIPAL